MFSKILIASRTVLLVFASIALGACQEAPNLQGQTSQLAMKKCEELSPHSADIDCKFALAKKSRAKVENLYNENLETAGKLDAAYTKAFPNDDERTDKDIYVHRIASAQKAWLSYVETQCAFEGDTLFGGSGGGDAEAECHDRLNLERLDELSASLKLARFSLVNYGA